MEPPTLELRVARLERRARIWQIVALSALLVMGLAAWGDDSVPDLIFAHKFVVVDENTRIVGTLESGSGGGQLSLRTKSTDPPEKSGEIDVNIRVDQPYLEIRNERTGPMLSLSNEPRKRSLVLAPGNTAKIPDLWLVSSSDPKPRTLWSAP